MSLDLRVGPTVICAILVMYLGEWLNRRIPLLARLNIPEPVTGGLAAAITLAVLESCGIQIQFHTDLRDTLLVVFFAIVGLSANLSVLKSGGKPLILLIGVAIFVVVMQDVIGISLAKLLGVHTLLGLVAGSVSMSGGHGTAIAWSGTLSAQGATGALEAGLACATLGLVAGGLIGGPLGRRLIDRYQLTPDDSDRVGMESSVGQDLEREEPITYPRVMRALLLLTVVIAVGMILHRALTAAGITVPAFLPCIMVGIVAANTLPPILPGIKPWPGDGPFLALVCQVCLNLFLVMSMMSIKLTALLGLALPVLLIALAQVLFIALVIAPLVFRLLGRSYDAAVMTSGYAGLALGATPTAVANMTSLTHRFGPSPRSFLVIPLVGTCFVDVANALVVNAALFLLK